MSGGQRRQAEIRTPLDRVNKRQKGQPGDPDHKKPAGEQGANVGYWQVTGATRSGAKRSKRA
jgi:hypothetical protein